VSWRDFLIPIQMGGTNLTMTPLGVDTGIIVTAPPDTHLEPGQHIQWELYHAGSLTERRFVGTLPPTRDSRRLSSQVLQHLRHSIDY